ncbi:MAG: LysR family transcriptional regulator [Frateuria sp.]|nr:LysR family transcriptional regulator [Frateuria sp.]
MDLPLNALRAFALVYRHRGVRAAARELGMAHSSVSRHLGELARWLGVPLLHAGAGRAGLVFTPQGEALGKAVNAGLHEIEQAVAALREVRPAHAVALSTTPSFAIRWLLPRLPAFEKAHPKIELSVLVDQKLEAFDDGRVDLAIRMGQGPWPNLHCETLMDDALYPVTSPAYWRDHGRPSRPAQLAGLRLLHDRDPQAAWDLWRRAHGPAGLALQGGARYASSDLVLRAAEQGQGVALARHRLAADDVAAGILLRPFGALEVPLGPSYWIVRPTAVRPRPALAAVIDWLRWQAAGR